MVGFDTLCFLGLRVETINVEMVSSGFQLFENDLPSLGAFKTLRTQEVSQ